MEIHLRDSTTLRDYLKVIFRHKLIFIILPIAIVIPVYLTLALKTPTYQSSVKMYVKARKQSESNFYSGFVSHNIIEEHCEFVASNIVMERVVEALKLYQLPLDYEKRFATRLKAALIDRSLKGSKQKLMEMPAEQRRAFLFQRAVGRLKGRVGAIPKKATAFFTITVTDFDPILTALIANSVSRSYVIFDLEQQILELQLKYGEKHSTVLQLQDYIKNIQLTLDGNPIPDIDAIGPASVKIVRQSDRGSPAGAINKNMLIAVSFIASIVLAVFYCFTFEIFDHSIRLPKDIKKFLNIPFLGALPKRKSRESLLISYTNPNNSIYTRSFQQLSEKLSLLMRDKNLKTLLLTDAEGSVETAAVVANLGMFMANKTASKVLVIDADFRTSSLSKLLNKNHDAGLVDILKGKISIIDAIYDMGSDLYVLPSGDTGLNPCTLLGSSDMSEVIKVAKEGYDFIFINSPGLKHCSDAIVLSSAAEGTVLVINEGKERKQVLDNALVPLRQKNANIIGAVLTNRKYVIPKIIYRLT